MKPACAPFCRLATAINPAHSGAAALVPPITMVLPSTRMMDPGAGPAPPATSGTPRPPAGSVGCGTFMPACQVGSGNMLLTPPPVAPPPCDWAFHTTSVAMLEPLPTRWMPPQARTCGLEAGKSTWFPVSLTPSDAPLSPAATVMVMPSATADWQAASSAAMAWAVQSISADPQEIEITLGLYLVS